MDFLRSVLRWEAKTTAEPRPTGAIATAVHQRRAPWCTCNSHVCRTVFLRSVKLVLRICGVSLSLFFTLCFGVWPLAHPHVDSFYDFSAWMSNILLGILVGCTGIYLEVVALENSQHFAKYLLNRLGAGIFYVWVGFQSFAAVDNGGDAENLLSKPRFVAGVAAWSVAWGNLTISCTAEESDAVHECDHASAGDIERGIGSNVGPSKLASCTKSLGSRGPGSSSHSKRGSPSTATRFAQQAIY